MERITEFIVTGVVMTGVFIYIADVMFGASAVV